MSAAREDEADVEVLAEDTHGQAATTAVSEVTYSEEADTTMAGIAHGTEEDTAMAVHTHSTEEDTALAEVTHIEFDVSGQGEAQEDESEEVVLDADVARFEPRSDLPHGQGDVFDQRSMVTNHLRRENGKQIHLDPALESHETDLDELDPVYFYSRETTGVLSSIRDRGKSGKARVYRASEVSGAVVAGAHGRKCDTFYQPDDDDPVGSVPTALGDHAAVDVSLEDPDLVQFQARIQHHAIATTSRKTDEVVSLWDPGANRSFISSRLVLEYNLPITRHLSKIKNGDGSEAVSPGYVTVTIHMGRFQAKVTLIVAPLSVYDFIMGFDLIKAHKVRLDFDPLRLSGISGGKAGKRVPIPTCVLSRRSPDGRDISTYTDEMPLKADNNHLQHEDPSWQEAFAVLPGESASDLLLYHSLHQELLELAESTAGAEDFRARATAWLHQKRSLDDFAEPGKKSSERARAEQVAQDDSSDLSAPLGELGEKEKVFRQRIVADYPHLCSDTLPEDGPSATWPNGEAYEVHLELKEGCTPEKRKQFRIPEAMREELEKTIEDLIKFKLIEPSTSQYNSPVFLVPKPPLKDGSFNGFRFVYDGRGVNKALKFDTYNIPRVEDMIERIARLKFEAERAGVTNMIISCLDQRTSFWQLKLAPECRHLTAFSTSTGVYQWCALPMGILTSSAHLQRFSQALLQPFSASNVFEYETTDERGLPVTRRAYGTAIAYIDDIAVCTFGSVEDHEVLLRRVLARMEHCHLRLQPKKCEFFRSQVDFLGHVLSADGIRQQDRKVAAIKNWPPLTVVTSIRAFCSMCSYYRRFVKDFAAIARPLTDLLRKDAVIKVGDEVLLSAENIRFSHGTRKLCPRFVGPFVVTQLLGPNTVEIRTAGRFRALSKVQNIAYLRPYAERLSHVGPLPTRKTTAPIDFDDDGNPWFEAEILQHRGEPHMRDQHCLVRWKGYDASHDQWLPRREITNKALVAYEHFLRDQAGIGQRRFQATTADMLKWQSFVGRQEQFSVIRANETAAKARATREHNRRVAAEAAAEKAAQQAATGGNVLTSRTGRVIKKPTPFDQD